MKIEKLPMKSVKLHPKNMKKHPAKNLKAIKGSILRFGQQHPVVVDANNFLLKGNGTYMVLSQLGWKDIYCVRSSLEHLEASAFMVADNRSSDLGEWDDEGLAETLNALQKAQFDLDAIGFDKKDLNKWLRGMNNIGGLSDSGANIRQEWLVVVECESESHQAEVFQQLQEAGEKCKIL